MIKNPPKYCSKILLFGEYTLMLGSKALIIPYNRFKGRLEFAPSESRISQASNKNLRMFAGYLVEHQSGFPGGLTIDQRRFRSDLDMGLYLNSDIPQGYGLGSSGLVVASVYAMYAQNPIIPRSTQDFAILKSYFSFMEACFHGRSSGLDPLSCYVGKPLLVESPEKTAIVDFPPENNDLQAGIFLVDTGQTSRTGTLVDIFLEKSKNSHFRNSLENQFIPRINNCIISILGGKMYDISDEVGMLSALQLKYFNEMIPSEFCGLWEKGISTGDYSLKLCGSGGGGYILGFTRNYKKSERFFNKYGKKLIKVY